MIRTLKLTTAAAALLALAACGDGGTGGGASSARSGIWAAGSSTVFPFATRVAENFARTSGGAAPRVESLGTGGGIQAFCQGVGPTTPDIANASRPMKAFLKESRAHGWPSFRTPEVHWEHVRVLPNGEVVSLDGTHLGHNLPDKSGNRFCINLVSIAGRPA